MAWTIILFPNRCLDLMESSPISTITFSICSKDQVRSLLGYSYRFQLPRSRRRRSCFQLFRRQRLLQFDELQHVYSWKCAVVCGSALVLLADKNNQNSICEFLMLSYCLNSLGSFGKKLERTTFSIPSRKTNSLSLVTNSHCMCLSETDSCTGNTVCWNNRGQK